MNPNDVCVCGDLRCEHLSMSGASFFTRDCHGFRLAPEEEDLARAAYWAEETE